MTTNETPGVGGWGGWSLPFVLFSVFVFIWPCSEAMTFLGAAPPSPQRDPNTINMLKCLLIAAQEGPNQTTKGAFWTSAKNVCLPEDFHFLEAVANASAHEA